MVQREDVISFILSYLGKDLLFKANAVDEVGNGVQFRGKAEVSKIALGVSLNADFLEKAVSWGADFCIFHHGFDPRTYKACYPAFSQKRMRLILENGLTVMGLHYVLDAHPEIGNNAVIIKRLGAAVSESLFDAWGYTGVFEEEMPVEKLERECRKLFNHEVFSILTGSKKVRKIGVVSGAGKPDAGNVMEMEAKRVDAFITGETGESVPHKMKESKINYLVCGHYATEVFGVTELGKKIKDHFWEKVEAKFIDIMNLI